MSIDWFNVAWEVFPFLFVAGLCVWLYAFFSKKVRNWKRVKRLKKGKEAESDAKLILKKTGYQIHDYQPQLNYEFLADQENVKVNITPDYLVKKDGIVYVVEVKSGEVASNPNYAATRRQLLEYSLVSEHPLLFVDMETKLIHKIKFPFGSEKSKLNWWKYLSLFFIVVLLAALFGMAFSAVLKLL
ncbi:MAG: hypothetical protein ACPGEG_05090 [Salibacteraceae bacterium]